MDQYCWENSNVSKCPCEFHNQVGSIGYWAPCGLPRLLSSRGYWAPEFNWLHRLPIDWAPWAAISPVRHLVSLAPNTINICRNFEAMGAQLILIVLGAQGAQNHEMY